MFDPTSRYSNLEIATMEETGSDGRPRQLRYVRRRFIPPNDNVATLAEHSVMQGDRLDNIAAHYLGDPQQFWRICDANNVLEPGELTDEIGTRITITLPQG